MWRSAILNRSTDLVGTVLQGHPVFVFRIAHNDDHHAHNHGPKDLARTYQFDGDHNHFLGYVTHPSQVLSILYPFFIKHIDNARIENRHAFYWLGTQYLLVIALWSALILIDPLKAVLYVIFPQLVCLHWLLASNYLQHAHADGLSEWNFARNFTGFINRIFFNIGFHTAHHRHPTLHWAELPRQHLRIAENIDPRMIELSFAWYVLRTFLLSAFMPSFRSHSLMTASEATRTNA